MNSPKGLTDHSLPSTQHFDIMLTSNELRWFYPGKIPEDIKVWFQRCCLIDQEQLPETREDIYLYVPESNFLGIKLRHGSLEVKWRTAELGVVGFGELVAGNAEKWAKWSCEDPTGESFHPTTVLSKSSWVRVEKTRYLQSYQVLSDFSVQSVANDECIDSACSLEITQLLIQNNTWWSLALEANAEDQRLMANLQATAKSVFKTYRGAKLLATNSYAYPYWLGLVCG
ncbi:hypothetical protein NIES23_14900 [Trichormus variabilis NIES-23]|uniref:Uncharacterized protein n=2 Tax=Nostocaceae TaxID=1162 RepID=A0A1Z4KIB1_ANAVA|nr:hypothetical protein [Nostoc sp. PCC 7120 = FACHB-418]BAY68702.1 hypothetical protein NIES23_14900 [Trichormus variabilis NIES-23]